MTPTPEHIERAARIGYQEFLAHPGPVHDWRVKDRPFIEAAFRATALAILRDHYAALAANGWQMARWEPTEKMRKAWADRDYSNAATIHFGVAFDAAPSWPGESK